MTTTIDIHDVADKFAELVAQAAAGTEVIVTDGNIPRARLVALISTKRQPGLHTGAIQTSPDFDAPLPDDFWAGQP